MGVQPVGHRHIHCPEEIDLLIAESRDGGLLEPDEHRRLRRALQLGIRPARHLMVPRQEIVGVDIDTPIDEVLQRMAETPYTRLPVYRGDIDHVEGLLHTKDLFRGYLAGGRVRLHPRIDAADPDGARERDGRPAADADARAAQPRWPS